MTLGQGSSVTRLVTHASTKAWLIICIRLTMKEGLRTDVEQLDLFSRIWSCRVSASMPRLIGFSLATSILFTLRCYPPHASAKDWNICIYIFFLRGLITCEYIEVFFRCTNMLSHKSTGPSCSSLDCRTDGSPITEYGVISIKLNVTTQ